MQVLALLKHRRYGQRVHATAQATAQVAGVIGGVIAAGHAHAVDLPDDRAEAMYHMYKGGGLTASGPALLVRKKMSDSISLNGTYYIDMVSNASIDVVTTASPFKEKRKEYTLGGDFVYQDALVSLSTTQSKEPDYTANTTNLDVTQDVFGGMTTVNLGYTRGTDVVLKKNDAIFRENAQHWRYRLGVTQILSPRWLMSLNGEAVSDGGYLGSPYRVARVFGSTVPERNPRTRTSRAVNLRAIGDVSGETGGRSAVRAEYRYFWDTWEIKAHTLEVGYSRYFRDSLLGDVYFRYYTQDHALFYSDDATANTTYVSRNRQLSTFKTMGLGTKMTWTARSVPGKYDVKLTGAYELVRFRFSDFTDSRTGEAYKFDANVLQLFVSATF
jgi:hypothetical protein